MWLFFTNKRWQTVAILALNLRFELFELIWGGLLIILFQRRLFQEHWVFSVMSPQVHDKARTGNEKHIYSKILSLFSVIPNAKGHRIEMGRNRSIAISMTWRVVCRRSLLLLRTYIRLLSLDFLCSVPATGIRRLPFAPTIIIRCSSLIMNLRGHDSENPITLE